MLVSIREYPSPVVLSLIKMALNRKYNYLDFGLPAEVKSLGFAVMLKGVSLR